MRIDQFTVTAPDGYRNEIRLFLPQQPRAVVQVVHGMAEHSARYERFALALADAGYGVALSDLRGHGAARGPRFHLADTAGWDVALADIAAVTRALQSWLRDVDVVLFGHSFGSFLARAAVCAPGCPAAGVVVSGPGGPPTAVQRVALTVARLAARAGAASRPSAVLSTGTYRSFNRGFTGPTTFEWLSRDRQAVDAYVEDPGCGGTATYGFFRDMLGGIAQVPRVQHRWPRALPTLIIAGSEDPVGERGAAPAALAAGLRAQGCSDVQLIVYPGARHELLQELNHQDVTADVLAWLRARW